MSYPKATAIKKHSLFLISIFFLGIFVSSCSMTIPKYTSIQSEYPPNYYLGDTPNVNVVEAEGATRRLQDIAIQELRNQSRSKGYFTIENQLSEGIRFDTQQGEMVMTGKNTSINSSDVFIKINIIAGMKQDGRTTITRTTGFLGTEEETVPAMMTILPVAFTVTKGDEVLLNERQYDGKAVWALDGNNDYPVDYRERLEIAVGKAVEEFIRDITPRTISRDVRLDYSDENQKPILDEARDGQVKEAAKQIENYVSKNPNSASAVYNLAVLTDAHGKYKKALNYYNKALSLGGKDYYTEAKTNCMKRLNEAEEMAEAEPTKAVKAAQTEPNTSNRNATEASITKTKDRPGNGGEDVQWVQETLNNLGYNCGTADGIMGDNTRACIEAFQQANSLRATGEVNGATYNVILSKIE